ncbi:MAG TPA: NF038129 family PEP-CTERM protein [Bryobacteraceae bacterium]|nr:NF038129 family PEP-CTERM protein [Bryobacteraceae bacterium]
MRLTKTLLSTIFFAGVLTTPAAFADPASIQYAITVNTSSALLSDGYIDFQFNPSSFTTQPANADVANFVSDGVLNPADPNNGTIGAVSGMLPGTVTLMNSQPSPNEYTEAMTFGTTITFDLDLYGPAISNPNGDGGGTFILDFFNDNGYLFTADSQNDVPVFTVTINGDGTTTASTYPSENNGPPVVTFVGPTPVPEPASVLMFLSGGLLALAVLGRRRWLANAKV